LVIWLPAHCPEFNLIELYWRHLKDLACSNKLRDSIQDVLASAQHFLNVQNNCISKFRITFSKQL
jgi:hypothetical protein